MSEQWYTIFGPLSWPGVKIKTGNKKVDGVYYNILNNQNIQLAASGVMWLAAGSGIRMISPGYVDVSGVRLKQLLYQKSNKINSAGQIIPNYDGLAGDLIYKVNDDTIAGIPGRELIFNTGLGKLTMPGKELGVLFVSSGNLENAPATKELASFPGLTLEPQRQIPQPEGSPPIIIPPKIKTSVPLFITDDINIYPNLDSYSGSILTHMGKDVPAEWLAAPYLKAEGATWTRLPKRPVMFEGDRMIFYKSRPKWAQDWAGGPDILTLEKEFGLYDTIQVIHTTQNYTYLKQATNVQYTGDETNTPEGVDVETPLESIYTDDVEFFDPLDDTPVADRKTVKGISVRVCYGEDGAIDELTGTGSTTKNSRLTGKPSSPTNGYAFSITKGAYFAMQLGRDSKDKFGCINPSTSPLKFKPSPAVNISIRPDTNTCFNMLGDNIDFVIYGERKTLYNNYDESLHKLDKSLTPTGLIPAFKIDAYVPSSASGTVESGVFYTKFTDRARVTPTGWSYDENPKILMHTNLPYIVGSLPTGVSGRIYNYADVTISGLTYTNQLVADKIFLSPKPLSSNSGVYIANSLLTLDRSGRIISRVPRLNPTAASKPSGVRLDPNGGPGNTELSIVWTKPDNDGRSTIIDYKIEFSTNNGDSWTAIPNNQYGINKPSGLVITASTIDGLSPLIDYRFRVAAINGIGVGSFSEASDPIRPGSSVPKKPQNLQFVRNFDDDLYSDIVLTWETPQAGTSEVLGYVIEESQDKGLSWVYYNAPSALLTDTSETISGTESRTDYLYRVSAWNTDGQSAFAYIFVRGNTISEIDPEEAALEQEKKDDVLSNWDFGLISLTGVCSI